jgi:hypothetical protein
MLYSYINYINLLPWLVIFQILMFADCLLNRSVKGLTRGKWLVVMFLLQGFGSFIYFAFAPSILFTTFLNGLVSLKQNATAIQIFIYCQQRKRQPSQPKISTETAFPDAPAYLTQISPPTTNQSAPIFYAPYELPHASYPTVENISTVPLPPQMSSTSKN